MKAIMVMFDSLNRRMLPAYGCDWTHAPNFRRLAERTVTFDQSYVCSMPCMPARRDLHTGRPNFLHRAWGPLEPFDDSVPKMLRENGTSSHLISDHYHYWESGGATYHTQYNTWQFFRGQEGDPWVGQVAEPDGPEATGRNAMSELWHRQDRVNRQFMQNEADQPQSKTFREGIAFLDRNHDEDNWFLQIETFDPHEPFFANRKYQDLYPHDYDGPVLDWPPYSKVTETDAEVEHIRMQYASLLSMCDAKLGDLLDRMDSHNMWEDTMLIVWTDHGFLLGEHDSWAKCWLPFYNEVAHTPFFMWDPRSKKAGERRQSIVQPSIDLGPTLLDFFGLEKGEHMIGHNLRETIADDRAVREAAMFGMFGAHVNVTDGQYVYMRGPADDNNGPLYEYTHMPTNMRGHFAVEDFANLELAAPFTFTKNAKTMKIERSATGGSAFSTLLFDVNADPQQLQPLSDEAVEGEMTDHLRQLMTACDAPPEQFARLGL